MGILGRLFGHENQDSCVKRESKQKPKVELLGIQYKDGSFKEDLDLEQDDTIKLRIIDATLQAVTVKDELINQFKFDDIIRVDLLNQEDIRMEVTAGRILAFGIFALAMQKEKIILRDRSLIVTYKDGEERKTFTTTFPTHGVFEMMGAALIGEINKYKISKEDRRLRGTWYKNLVRKK